MAVPSIPSAGLITRDNRALAFDSQFAVAPHIWYHVAVVGDTRAGTVALYVNGIEAGGSDGFNGLFSPVEKKPWTLGRGQFRGKLADLFFGNLDEVRFSDEALTPSQFLNFSPPTHPGPPMSAETPGAEALSPDDTKGFSSALGGGR